MKNFWRVLLTAFLLLALSVPAWANGSSKKKLPCLSKNDTHYGQYHSKHKKVDKHKLKVLKEFRKLKAVYGRTIKDAQQMFLEFIGSAEPPADCDVQAVRDEYEQQISQLNATIASQQTQITQLQGSNTALQSQLDIANATITDLNQQLTAANATIIALQTENGQLKSTLAAQLVAIGEANDTINALQIQIDALNATIKSKDDEINALNADKATWTKQCDDRVQIAYDDGKADGQAQCPATGPAAEPQENGSWSTGSLYPYALDVDGSGNTVALDRNTKTIAVYDSNGGLIGSAWTAGTFVMPTDVAVDSNGDVYVLDAGAVPAVQKFSASGQPDATFSLNEDPSFPTGLFIDNNNAVYVTDQAGGTNGGGRILVYDNINGNKQGSLGDLPDLAWEQFNDVAVDEVNQIVYVVSRSGLVAKLSKLDGSLLGSWGDFSTMRTPNSIAIGAQGQVFIADTYNNEIDQYDADGSPQYSFNSNGQLYRPARIVVDGTGKLYYADERNGMIRVYQ